MKSEDKNHEPALAAEERRRILPEQSLKAKVVVSPDKTAEMTQKGDDRASSMEKLLSKIEHEIALAKIREDAREALIKPLIAGAFILLLFYCYKSFYT
ncbi:MAG: hypothetical protein K0S07_1504 [Chlamydiales bacterium]|jgi:hypothetical protein|nr:hypothetical protein [Chlamydiales bacterium]